MQMEIIASLRNGYTLRSQRDFETLQATIKLIYPNANIENINEEAFQQYAAYLGKSQENFSIRLDT